VGLHRWKPYARVDVLEDGWYVVWEHVDQSVPDLICPQHANDRQPTRPPAIATIGDVTVDLQEFNYIMTRPPDIAMFKHITTRRYLNLIKRGTRVVACKYIAGSNVSELDLDEGFRRARIHG